MRSIGCTGEQFCVDDKVCFPGDCEVRAALLGVEKADTNRPVFRVVAANANFATVDLASRTVYLAYGEPLGLSLLPCATNTSMTDCW